MNDKMMGPAGDMIEHLRRALADRDQRIAELKVSVRSLSAIATELSADNTRLREALRMYGAHQYDCVANQPCSCGFNEMRKALAPQPEKEGE